MSLPGRDVRSLYEHPYKPYNLRIPASAVKFMEDRGGRVFTSLPLVFSPRQSDHANYTFYDDWGYLPNPTKLFRGEQSVIHVLAFPCYGNNVEWQPSGDLIAVGGYRDGKRGVFCFDASDGRELFCFDTGAAPTCIAWSPDGSRLAATSYTDPVFVWSVLDGSQLLSATILPYNQPAVCTLLVRFPTNDILEVDTGLEPHTFIRFDLTDITSVSSHTSQQDCQNIVTPNHLEIKINHNDRRIKDLPIDRDVARFLLYSFEEWLGYHIRFSPSFKHCVVSFKNDFSSDTVHFLFYAGLFSDRKMQHFSPEIRKLVFLCMCIKQRLSTALFLIPPLPMCVWLNIISFFHLFKHE